jgi:hypothetical protein
MMKHFPTFKTKFIPDAIAHTVAPESWRVLLSQRRRWINSTVHNLCELVMLPELFGFCCFSMRFFVFIDLLGTLVCTILLSSKWFTDTSNAQILPATVVYVRHSWFLLEAQVLISICIVGISHRHSVHRPGSSPYHFPCDDCRHLWFTGASELQRTTLYTLTCNHRRSSLS